MWCFSGWVLFGALCGFVHNMAPSGGVGFWVGFFVWVSATCWVLVFVRISILDGLLVVMIAYFCGFLVC